MREEKVNIITGGLILIALGGLILLSNLGIYEMSQSWPILVVFVGVLTIFRKFKDLSGWMVAAAGVALWLTQSSWMTLNKVSVYLLPLVVVILGVIVITNKKQHGK